MTRKIYLSILLCLLSIRGFSYSIVPGNASICIGATLTETVFGPAGSWSSSNPAVATVGASSGVVTGIAAGTAMILYNSGKNSVYAVVTVNACCLTNSLVINPGYDPLTGLAIAGEAGDNGTAITDPKWIVTGISPDAAGQIAAQGSTAVSLGGQADIIDADLSPTYPAGSWTVNATSSPSSWITAQNAHGYETDNDNTLDLWMILSRPFSMCLSDSVMIDAMIANDNYIVSANIDDTLNLPDFAVQAAAGSNPDEHANHEEFQHFVTSAGIYLAPGTHKLNIVVQNYNFPESTIYNPTGMNLYGTLYSLTGHNSLVKEDDSTCKSYSCSGEEHTTAAPLVAQFSGDLVCFPNPNSGSFTLSGALSAAGTAREVSLEVIDIMGNVVYNDIVTITNGGIDKTISLRDDIANGVYLIKVVSENSSKVIRVSINR